MKKCLNLNLSNLIIACFFSKNVLTNMNQLDIFINKYLNNHDKTIVKQDITHF